MNIEGAVALVSGANRGLGEQFVHALLERGATKVYAAARNPEEVTNTHPAVVPIALDITDAAAVRAAAELAGDVTLLVNNAGSANGGQVLDADLDVFRAELDTHVFGTLAMTRAFAPALGRNGGGAVLNVLSVLSWLSFPDAAAYCAAKAAAWSVTNSLRAQLAQQDTLVTALHVAYMDTRMAEGVDAPKADPAKVARVALDGIAAGHFEVLADDTSRQVKAALAGDPGLLYPQLAGKSFR